MEEEQITERTEDNINTEQSWKRRRLINKTNIYTNVKKSAAASSNRRLREALRTGNGSVRLPSRNRKPNNTKTVMKCKEKRSLVVG